MTEKEKIIKAMQDELHKQEEEWLELYLNKERLDVKDWIVYRLWLRHGVSIGIKIVSEMMEDK